MSLNHLHRLSMGSMPGDLHKAMPASLLILLLSVLKGDALSQNLSCGGSLPAARYWPHIIDDLPVARPDKANGLWSAYSSRAWVACRPKPVILRSSCCPGPDSGIGRAIHSVCKHLHTAGDWSACVLQGACQPKLVILRRCYYPGADSSVGNAIHNACLHLQGQQANSSEHGV